MSPEQLNVLVIDDDEAIRDLLVEAINERGHLAVTADSAEEGLGLLPFWTFHVALVDYHLPGIDGIVLSEYLRANNPAMKIALVTGEQDRQLQRRSRRSSITFISKPFQVRQIAELIEEYNEDSRERAQRERQQHDEDYAPPIARYFQELRNAFDVPRLPGRIEERLATALKQRLHQLQRTSFDERDRVELFAGLLAVQLLGLDVPRLANGRSLCDEYDQLMEELGKRPEFGDQDD
jgi:DNA-binding NtrC family response regulator